MNLSKFSDFSFRTLIYLAKNQDKQCTVQELATNLEISEHHLKKVVHQLAKTDYLISSKGRNGGLKIGMDPKDINLGEVLKLTEDNNNIVECFSIENNCCNLTGSCCLKGVIGNALDAFINEFSKHTLADIIK